MQAADILVIAVIGLFVVGGLFLNRITSKMNKDDSKDSKNK